MCIVSMVHDHHQNDFEEPWKRWPGIFPTPDSPAPYNPDPAATKADIARLEKLIKDFWAALAAAKFLDGVLAQPDCVDPEKAKLQERVKELEAKLQAMKEALNA